MEKDQIFILKDRGIIYISGEDAKDFLQNIVTNNINTVSYTHLRAHETRHDLV